MQLLLRSLMVSLVLLGAGAAAARQDDTGLATFDKVWRVVRDEHFDPDLNGIDWEAVRRELRPAAERAHDVAELRAVIADMLSRLGQSHFTLVPKEQLPPRDGDLEAASAEVMGEAGLDLRVRDGEVLVWRAWEPAAEAGVAPGWLVTSIDGLGPDELEHRGPRPEAPDALRRWTTDAAQEATYGPVGSTIELTLLDADGSDVELRLERTERDVLPHALGRGLPVFHLTGESWTVERDGLRLGVIRFNFWFEPTIEEAEAALDTMADCDGIVLDQRGNGGGRGDMATRLAGRFLAKRTVLGEQRMRRRTQRYVANPRRPVLDAPLAILTDELTGSTAEVFTGSLQSVGRARIFGERSAGAVLPAHTTLLPNGDSLIHAVGDYRTATGDLLEGRGVRPDVEVPLRRADLFDGVDAPLEAALDWLAEEGAR
ncbi:MAG: S41 family peptidase [Planctomycetota bacterium]